MTVYTTPETVQNGLQETGSLETIFPFNAGENETGIAISAYGKGQATGVTYTVPAHGEITVDFRLKLLCVTPEDVQNLSDLVKASLDASHKKRYLDYEKTHISGGASFFGFFGWGGAKGSYTKIKERMDSWGLSEKNQQTIINAMMNTAQKVCEFNYSGTIYNRFNDYDVTGSLFGIVMDAVIKQDQYQHQLRFLAPNVHIASPDGVVLPVLGKLYEHRS